MKRLIVQGAIRWTKESDLTPEEKIALFECHKELALAGFVRIPGALPPYPVPTRNIIHWWKRRGVNPETWAAGVRKHDKDVECATPYAIWREGWFHLTKGRFIPPYLLKEAVDYARASLAARVEAHCVEVRV